LAFREGATDVEIEAKLRHLFFWSYIMREPMPPNQDQRTHAQSRRTAKATPSVMGRIAHKQTLQAPDLI
jgi:hypothetical protein